MKLIVKGNKSKTLGYCLGCTEQCNGKCKTQCGGKCVMFR